MPDFHELIATATNANFVKNKSTIKYYRDYKNFDADMFDKDLSHGRRDMHSFNYGISKVSKNISG